MRIGRDYSDALCIAPEVWPVRLFRLFNLTGLTVVLVVALCASADQTPANKPSKTSSDTATVQCRVLEMHASEQPAVMAVLFHQGDTSDRDRLSDLLKQYSGKSVYVKSGAGDWHPATVIRLGDCFGRGLLLMAAGSNGLKDKEEFSLRFREPGK
jgi:hypothetical protein